MNMDYHAAREAWLDQRHRWLMFGVIVAGGSALVDVWPVMRIWGPAFAVVAGALDLTFDLSTRSRKHADLRRRYAEINSEATAGQKNLVHLQSKMDVLSGEEEPPYHALLALSAMRAQTMTYGKITDPCRPSFPYRFFAHVIRFDGRDFNESTDDNSDADRSGQA
ncbi:hypothetical protein [Croceicoccus marinus]|uniref:SLATT domain-containing protein n=1 Tax=Croceicoccus marinus TaxID=450378 RepID=A0A7G6VRU0_9SPHN|nr:hypothetical protein [Croceicoccus marinus]QNE04455.1 hypothetical protein H4O24_10765 [Croceicoccus marinus]